MSILGTSRHRLERIKTLLLLKKIHAPHRNSYGLEQGETVVADSIF